MKKILLKIVICCLAVMLFVGCSITSPAQTNAVNEPSPQITDVANSEMPNDIPETANEIVKLFKEFTTIDWNSSPEDIKREHPDFSTNIDGQNVPAFSDESDGMIMYEKTLYGKRFITTYTFVENKLYEIKFAPHRLEKLSSDDLEQIKAEVNEQIKLLDSDMREAVRSEALTEFYDDLFDSFSNYISKTKFGYVYMSFASMSYAPSDYSLNLDFYPPDSALADSYFLQPETYKSIDDGIAGLFEEFKTISWDSSPEDIRKEHPDNIGILNLITYEMGDKQFSKIYKFEDNKLTEIKFSKSVTLELSEDEWKQINTSIDKQIKLLNINLKKISWANLDVAKTEFGYVFIYTDSSSDIIEFHSLDSSYAQDAFSRAK